MRRILLAIALTALASNAHADARAFNNDPFGDHSTRSDSAAVAVHESEAATAASNGIGLSYYQILVEHAGYSHRRATAGWYMGGGFYGASYALHGGLARRSSPGFSWGLGIGYAHNQQTEEIPYSVYSSPTRSTRRVAVEDLSSGGVWPHGWIEMGKARGLALRLQAGAEGLGIVIHSRSGAAETVKTEAARDSSSSGRAARPADTNGYVQPKIYGR